MKQRKTIPFRNDSSSLTRQQLAAATGGKRYRTHYDYDGDGKTDTVVTDVDSQGNTRIVKVIFGK